MLCGVLNSVALAPDILERLITAKDEDFVGGGRAIQISLLGRIPAGMRLELKSGDDLGLSQISKRYARMVGDKENVPPVKPEECTLQTLTFNFPGVEGSVKFVDWKINAPEKDTLFQARRSTAAQSRSEFSLYAVFDIAEICSGDTRVKGLASTPFGLNTNRLYWCYYGSTGRGKSSGATPFTLRSP